MVITATMVRDLRDLTGVGMMDCKQALEKAEGNIDEAIRILREAGQAKAERRSARTAGQGVIAIQCSVDRRSAVMLELNCETDFVAKQEDFLAFANASASTALANQINDLGALAQATLIHQAHTVEASRLDLVTRIGENIHIRRLVGQYNLSKGRFASYIHHGAKIGVLVCVHQGSDEFCQELAMHIAASSPLAISSDDIDSNLINREKDILTTQFQASGKPQAIIDKMIQGGLEKFLKELSLLDQSFLTDSTRTVRQVALAQQAEILAFYRYRVGEGIPKQESNFVQEVMDQLKGK